MELYQIRSFIVVATELHFGRAASRLVITQPTLSRQIAALEKDLGVPLFERYGRRIRLSPAGRMFLDRAEDLVRRADAAARDAQRAAVGELGELRVGSVQSAIPEALPRLLTGFRIAAPDVRLSVTSMTTVNQLRALMEGELDLGLLRPQQPRAGIGDLRTRTISHDHWVAVLPAGHRLARRRKIGLVDLADEDFVLYGPEIGTTGHDQILDHCAAVGFAPRIVQQTTDAQTTVALVAAGLGVSLILSPTPPMSADLVAYRPLTDQLPVWELAIAWSDHNPSATLRRFLAVLAGR